MLQFINGRFHAFGISFTLPDGFHLDTETDTPCENGLCCLSPDQKIYYVLYVDEDCEDARMGLKRLFEPGSSMHQRSEIRPLVINELSGYGVAFNDGEYDYYEANLQTSEGSGLIFYAHCKTDLRTDIERHPATQAILQTVSVDGSQRAVTVVRRI